MNELFLVIYFVCSEKFADSWSVEKKFRIADSKQEALNVITNTTGNCPDYVRPPTIYSLMNIENKEEKPKSKEIERLEVAISELEKLSAKYSEKGNSMDVVTCNRLIAKMRSRIQEISLNKKVGE